MAGGGLTGALPDLAHAVASDALPAPVAVLVFPLTFVALDVAGAASSPFGVWGSPAQPQHASKPLLQVAALGGGGVVTGLLGLSAAALGLALTNAPGAGPTLVVAVALVIAVHLWGAVRLARARAGMSVRVAGLVEASGDSPTGDPLALLMQDERLDDAAWHRVRSASTAVLADLIARTQDALAGGAQLVVWAEGAGLVPAGHEDEVVAHVADLARRYDGHVALALAVAHRDGPRHVDNRVVLVAPGGHATLDTRKARPVPGAEADHTIPGDGALAWVDTALVRLGVLACFDLDLPRLSRQAAGNRVDILLVPASDWPAISPLHTEMAVLPAIANGCTVVRPARWGRSAAIDPYGRFVATADHVGPGERRCGQRSRPGGSRRRTHAWRVGPRPLTAAARRAALRPDRFRCRSRDRLLRTRSRTDDQGPLHAQVAVLALLLGAVEGERARVGREHADDRLPIMIDRNEPTVNSSSVSRCPDSGTSLSSRVSAKRH